MKKKHKTYSRPKRPFDKVRLEEEAEIKKEFGLKNKKEIWKAEARIKSMREKAKKLISASPEDQKILFEKLKKIGLNVDSISDVLALTKEDYLKRRLQTIVAIKNISTTLRGARQLITHKKILVNNRIVSVPSYVVPIEFEGKITKRVNKKKTIKEKVIEIAAEGSKEKNVEETKLKGESK